MLICTPCRTIMKCDRTGARATFQDGRHVYPGDRYVCPKCGSNVLACTTGVTTPFYTNVPLEDDGDRIIAVEDTPCS